MNADWEDEEAMRAAEHLANLDRQARARKDALMALSGDPAARRELDRKYAATRGPVIRPHG